MGGMSYGRQKPMPPWWILPEPGVYLYSLQDVLSPVENGFNQASLELLRDACPSRPATSGVAHAKSLPVGVGHT